MSRRMWPLRIYMWLLSLNRYVVLAGIVLASWFGGWKWGLGLAFVTLLVVSPLLLLPLAMRWLQKQGPKLDGAAAEPVLDTSE